MGKKYLRCFSLSLNRHGLCIFLRSLSPNIPVSGWWSFTTITFGRPIMNMHDFSCVQAIAAAYQCSASVQNVLPANTMCYLLGQHTAAFSVGYVQCFCNRRKPMPFYSSLRSGRLLCCCQKLKCPFLLNPQWFVWIAEILFWGSHSKQIVSFI